MKFSQFFKKKSLSSDNDRLERIAEYYANGDITKQEFLQLKKETEATNLKRLLDTCFSKKLSVQVKHAQAIMRSNGRTTGYAPLGYINVRIKGKACVVLDMNAAPLIKDLFKKYASGKYSIAQIHAYAYLLGLKGKIKHNPLTKATIKRILTNKYYCGFAKHKDIEFEHQYPCIIDMNLFNKCQQILKRKGLI